MLYGCQTWGLHDTSKVTKIQTLQNSALRLVTFADKPNSPYQHNIDIYKDLRLLKFRDIVTLKNLIFVHDFFNNNLPVSFAGYFILSSNIHSYPTRTSSRGHIHVPNTNSVKFGTNSFKIKTIHAWNILASKFPETDLLILPRKKFISLLVNYLIENYSR